MAVVVALTMMYPTSCCRRTPAVCFVMVSWKGDRDSLSSRNPYDSLLPLSSCLPLRSTGKKLYDVVHQQQHQGGQPRGGDAGGGGLCSDYSTPFSSNTRTHQPLTFNPATPGVLDARDARETMCQAAGLSVSGNRSQHLAPDMKELILYY